MTLTQCGCRIGMYKVGSEDAGRRQLGKGTARHDCTLAARTTPRRTGRTQVRVHGGATPQRATEVSCNPGSPSLLRLSASERSEARVPALKPRLMRTGVPGARPRRRCLGEDAPTAKAKTAPMMAACMPLPQRLLRRGRISTRNKHHISEPVTLLKPCP